MREGFAALQPKEIKSVTAFRFDKVPENSDRPSLTLALPPRGREFAPFSLAE